VSWRADDPRHLVAGNRRLEAEDARRLDEALHVVCEPEDEQLLLLLVPVSAYPAEAAEPVVEGLGAHADGRVGVIDEVVAMVGDAHVLASG